MKGRNVPMAINTGVLIYLQIHRDLPCVCLSGSPIKRLLKIKEMSSTETVFSYEIHYNLLSRCVLVTLRIVEDKDWL